MATPVMPEAPEPQNRMLAPAQGAPAPSGMTPAPNAMQGPQPAMPAAPTDPARIIEARQHLDFMIAGFTKLVSTPRGELTKKDAFDVASDLIARNVFPTAADKQGLIVELAGLPDDESGLRKALGAHLLQAMQAKIVLDHHIQNTMPPQPGAQ